MANNQQIVVGASGNFLEFVLTHSAGNTVSGATPQISFVSPIDTSLTVVPNSQTVITELSPIFASGHYLFQPTPSMVEHTGTLKIYASGTGKALGQTGNVPSTLTSFYVDVVNNQDDDVVDENVSSDMSTYITGLPQKFTRTVLVGKATRATQTVVKY